MTENDFANLFRGDDRADFKNGTISISWSVGDVDCVIEDKGYVFEPELTKKEKMNVLLHVLRYHDATVGINWDVLDSWLTHLYGDRMKEKKYEYYLSRVMDDKDIEEKWDELEDVPIDFDENGERVLGCDWFIFDKGTDLEETIWHWFDDHHSKGVGWLLNDYELDDDIAQIKFMQKRVKEKLRTYTFKMEQPMLNVRHAFDDSLEDLGSDICTAENKRYKVWLSIGEEREPALYIFDKIRQQYIDGYEEDTPTAEIDFDQDKVTENDFRAFMEYALYNPDSFHQCEDPVDVTGWAKKETV